MSLKTLKKIIINYAMLFEKVKNFHYIDNILCESV